MLKLHREQSLKETQLFNFFQILDLLISFDVVMVNMELETINVKHDHRVVRKCNFQFEKHLVEVRLEKLPDIISFMTITL